MDNIQKRQPSTSLWIGIAVSVLFGLAFAIPTYLATAWIWEPLGLALAIGVGGYVAKALLMGGYEHIRIDAAHCGIATSIGDKPTGTVLDAGDHWGFPGISGVKTVDMRHQRINLKEKIIASAADTSDIGVDGFVFVKKVDPLKTIGVKDLEESIRKLFESRVRLFGGIVSKAENAVKFRDLLSDYLELDECDAPALKTFKDNLIALPNELIIPNGIDALMQKGTVGAFKKSLSEWGVEVEEVEIEQFDIPQSVKEAKLKKANEATLMDAEKIRNTARNQMVAKLVKSGVHPDNAINSVDMLLGLAVKKEIKEITITDLDKIADKLGGPIAGILAKWIANQQPNQNGGRNGTRRNSNHRNNKQSTPTGSP